MSRAGLPLAWIAISICAALAATALSAIGPGERLEHATLDARFEIRGQRAAPADLVILAIDDRTLDDVGLRWPFPRGLHAEAIERIDAAGARALVYDVVFGELTGASDTEVRGFPDAEEVAAEQDALLLDALDRARPVAVASSRESADGAGEALGGPEVQRLVGAVTGSVNYAPDGDGVIRRLERRPNALDHLSVVGAELAGERVERFDERLMDYAGGAGTVRTVSLSRLLDGEDLDLRSRIVLVGATSPSLQDIQSTPYGLMPGVEVLANAIETARDGGLAAPGLPVSFLAALCLALAGASAVGLTRPSGQVPVVAIAALAGISGAYLVASQLAFSEGLVLPVVGPLGALVVATTTVVTTRIVGESRARRRQRELFGRFVPDPVIDRLMAATDGSARIPAERMVATVMFVDLRGFSGFAERTPPTRAIGFLDLFLSEMTEAVLDHGGTLVSYLGDGLMAVFGAPLSLTDHADRAVAAAQEMLGPRLRAVNDHLAAEGALEPFRMGIGLASGQVMSGTVGSGRRLGYTTIGDTANVASRLEGLNKQHGTALLMTEGTHDLLDAKPANARRIGEATVKGRQAPVVLWTIAGLADDGSVATATSGASPH